MADPVFDRAVAAVLAHEGGLVDDPDDPGGLTNFGISLRAYPELGADGIRALTADAAAAIYRRDWWDRYGWGDLPAPIAAKVLDIGVNIGAGPVHRLLQRALRATGADLVEDGVLGSATRAAAAAAEGAALLAALRSEAAAHYRLIVAARPASQRFLTGWLVRAYA
ncbi:MAG TPA: glycosyl hydrolase 108 family protein [Stellaceae bacterium]|nr:glycosyl hydrolase 108 family protein [Stellaceae bacterium]HUN46570.1 glycosyl hydrolase 108 family protein [Stellaceae bacterium]